MAPGKIVFHCRGCNRVLSVDEKLKGRKIRCSQCKRISLIPAASTAKLPDDTAPQTGGDATTIQQPPAEPSPDGGETATPETEAPPPSDDDAQPESEPAPPEPAAAGNGDTEDWQTRAQQAEDQLAALTAQREKEEVAYSRTITKLTTQLEEAKHLREQLEAEAADRRQQQQRWESNTEQQVETTANVLAAAREAVDVFCNDQLGAMQSLRQSLKELTGEES